ncbi:MAG: hypothetical protein IKK75_04410 [Clostridia bacterium]|nr:hypothetical protein [Clostridia bacterium]
MKGFDRWDYHPYCRLTELDKAQKPYVCRLAPFENGFSFEWFDRGAPDTAHTVLYREHGSAEPMKELPVFSATLEISGLKADTDYEFLLKRADGSAQSDLRLVRTGQYPGMIVNYLHPQDPAYITSGRYLCSPSIAKLPDGALLASMDVYEGGGPQNLTLIFRSDDGGQNWRYVTDLMPCFWGKLFWHRGALYMLGCTTEYGDLVISRSLDEGQTWPAPVHLFPGSRGDVGMHKAPMPVIEHEGKLYTCVEYGSWASGGHADCMLTIDAYADLLNPKNWHMTVPVRYDSAWPGAVDGPCPGCIEGNAVVSPEGTVCDYLRIDHANAKPSYGKAVILERVDADAPMKLRRIVDCPVGSNSKFQLRRDPVTGVYLAVGSEVVDPSTPRQRTVLSLCISRDFETWKVVHRLIDRREADPQKEGFQYVDWQFDGDDLIVACRTAVNGAHNFHDSNCITFHRVKNFRQWL